MVDSTVPQKDYQAVCLQLEEARKNVFQLHSQLELLTDTTCVLRTQVNGLTSRLRAEEQRYDNLVEKLLKKIKE